MSEAREKQISDYLESKMSETSRQAFEKKLSEDSELAEEVRDLQSLEQALQAAGMDDLISDMHNWELEINQTQSGGIIWKKLLAVAAIITLILVPALYLFNSQKPTSEELFLSYYEPYDELITTRGNVDSLNLLLIDGMDAYNQGAYQECSDLLVSYLELNPEAYRVALYLAIAQLELNLQEEAELNFLKAQEDPVFKQQAEWYQALSYLKFSETKKAKVVLKSIANSKNHYRKNQADRLLKDLG